MLWSALLPSPSLVNLVPDLPMFTAGLHHQSTGLHSLVMDLTNSIPPLLDILLDVTLKLLPLPPLSSLSTCTRTAFLSSFKIVQPALPSVVTSLPHQPVTQPSHQVSLPVEPPPSSLMLDLETTSSKFHHLDTLATTSLLESLKLLLKLLSV